MLHLHVRLQQNLVSTSIAVLLYSADIPPFTLYNLSSTVITCGHALQSEKTLQKSQWMDKITSLRVHYSLTLALSILSN